MDKRNFLGAAAIGACCIMIGVFLSLLPLSSAAQDGASSLGIVLLHGKKGTPHYLHDLKTALTDQGYLVSTPEMCWSQMRMYDRVRDECLREIDTAVSDLRQRGAKRIVIAGHSLGGAAAIAYGAEHEDVTGVIGIAAGDAFWGPPSMLPDIARAKALLEQGKGDAYGEFADISTAGGKPMWTTAAHFLSFVALPEERMMPANAARLRAPLLLIGGKRDALVLRYEARAYEKLPEHALNRFLQLDADHESVVSAAAKPALDWLAALLRDSSPVQGR